MEAARRRRGPGTTNRGHKPFPGMAVLFQNQRNSDEVSCVAISAKARGLFEKNEAKELGWVTGFEAFTFQIWR